MTEGSQEKTDLSIVVPLYNEEDCVAPLYEAIAAVLESLGGRSEILFVDDGSSDRTFEKAAALAAHDRRLRVVKFRRNYGQTPAMAAGIDLARGTYIVTMDGDLQNDPRDIARFIAMLDQGYDMVVGWRFERQDKLVSRKIPSRIANWLIGRVTGVRIKDNGCSLKGFRAGVIKNVPLYSEMHRFIPAVTSITGARIAEIKVRHHARRFGESKYGLSRVYKVLFDLLTIRMVSGFASRPLMWFALLAFPFFVLSSVILVWQVLTMAVGGEGSLPIAGTGIFFGALCFFLLCSGGLAELINRTGSMEIMKASLLTAHEKQPERDRAAQVPREMELLR